MTSFRPLGAAHLRGSLLAALCVLPAALGAQQGTPAAGRPPAGARGTPARNGFSLFALVDFAATGVRANNAPYRFFVSNAGPMDTQDERVRTQSPAVASGNSQFSEITLFAAAAPGDRARAIANGRTSLGNTQNGSGAAFSLNFHKSGGLITSDFYSADGSLGFFHSGVRSSATGCLNHSPHLAAGMTLMPASDCPETWGLNGFQGRRPISQAAFQQVFAANPAGFRFNFFEVPLALQDTSRFLGDRFQTYGTIVDYSRERIARFGTVVPGGAGGPADEGYPLGLEYKFDAFTMNEAPGVVFWQATITNRTDSIYGGGGISYDSLYLGVVARSARRLRGHVGFDPATATAYFNEVGNDDASNVGNCDGALPVPGNFASDAFFGDCREPVRFANGASAITFLKSPIGDVRYKLFTDPTSPFLNATSPVKGDTITFNIGRMCGDECITERAAISATAGFGIAASQERLALNGDSPLSLSPLQYWMLFHPQNSAATDVSRRVNPDNPRAGGGFNFTPLPGWSYGNRPAGAPAGSDTLFFDTCNPTLAPAATPIVVPRTRAEFGRCTGRWVDTMPDKTLNFTRNATWLGAGPFRLAAGASTSLVLAITVAPDSATLENNVLLGTNLYRSFFVASTPPPAPRITAVRANGGTIRQTSVRVFFENRALTYTDPFITQLADRFRNEPAASNSAIGRLNRLNPRIRRPGAPASDTGVSIADTLRTLASRQVSGYNVYKSCRPGTGEYTRSTSPNMCTTDFVTDSLGRNIGPAVYATLSDTAYSYSDGNVLAGLTYQYVFVPIQRGVRLQLVTDSSVVAGRVQRTIKDTVLVAGSTSLPTLLSAPNVATVYVPASTQAGGTPSRTVYVSETGAQTFEGDSTAFAGPVVTVQDTLSERVDLRLVFGDSLQIREYQTSGGLDSTVIMVYRSAPTGFTFASATADPFSRFATPIRSRLDSLRFARIGAAPVSRSVVGTVNTGAPAAFTNPTTTTSLGGTRTLVRTSIRNTGGALTPAGTIFTANPATVPAGSLPAGVLLRERNGVVDPIIVGNDFRGTAFGLNANVVGGAGFADVTLDVQNRPVIIAYTATAAGGAQILDRFFRDPDGVRFAAAATQSAVPTLDLQPALTRFTGAATGEFLFRFLGEDFGPIGPLNLNVGPNQLQDALNASLAARVKGQRTQKTDEVVRAINASLGTTMTVDSLLEVNLPFTIRDNSRDRMAGGREVIAAIRAVDKFYSPATLAATATPAAARYFQVGVGLDTARVTVPETEWVPGEPLILLERVQVAEVDAGVVRTDAAGKIVYRDTLLVIATRATLGCRATTPAFCNPLEGRGGTGYTPTRQGYNLVVRVGVPLGGERDIRFAVTPSVSGTRVARVSRAQLDSVTVVPNPYILYSSFEQGRGNEQRIMFTHLPPQGHIRIYTATGQFVQQLNWTQAELRGSGDLYFNLLTREGTLMASGLYVFTVESTGTGNIGRRKQVGRFIIIR